MSKSFLNISCSDRDLKEEITIACPGLSLYCLMKRLNVFIIFCSGHPAKYIVFYSLLHIGVLHIVIDMNENENDSPKTWNACFLI